MSFAAVLQKIEKAQNPYPGLRPFETQESSLFFGRDAQIAELVTQLQQTRLVAVMGVSGSGKSSLVRAGLIPALERTHVGGAGARWRFVVTRPAGVPFQSLSRDLEKQGLDASGLQRSSQGLLQVAGQLDSDETLLVVVDQFEELFRYRDVHVIDKETRQRREASASEAAEFVQLLLDATQYLPPVFVVLTMRSDYLGECAEFRGLPEVLNECQYLVPRLTRQQRAEAIEGPLGHTEIAPCLVQRILNDTGDEPDRLPLLQHVLMRTWSQWRKSDPRQTRRIELQDYENPAVGGLEHALDVHAEELLRKVPREIAEKIFKRLTAQGRGRKERRDPTSLADLWEVCAAETESEREEVTQVIDRFRLGEATFLTPRDGALAPNKYIDITHESLIQMWGTLRGWVAEEAESSAHFLRIYDDAALYAQHKVDLWRDPKLQLALDWWEKENPNAAWARRYIGGATIDDSGFRKTGDFLERSRDARQDEMERASRRRRRIITSTGIAMLVMSGLILWGMINRAQMKRAQKAVEDLLTQEKAYAEKLDTAKRVAIAQAEKAKAYADQMRKDEQEERAQEQRAMARAMAFRSLDDQTEHPDQLKRSTLYAIESVKREPTSASIHTLQTAVSLLRHPVAHIQQKGYVWRVQFSPDGRFLATAGEDGNATIYDSKGHLVKRLPHNAEVWALAFSGDGNYLATGCDDGVRVFETRSWRQVWRGFEGQLVGSVAFSPDAQLLAIAGVEKSVVVINGKTGKEVWRVQYDKTVAVAFSPDGRYIATGGEDGVLRSTEIHHTEPAIEKHLKVAVRSITFAPDNCLAVGDEDGIAHVFDARGNEVTHWTHRGAVNAVGFSPDGRYLATGSDDGAAHVFEVADWSEVLLDPHKSAVLSVAFSSDGRLASSSLDGAVEVVEVKSRDEFARLSLPSGFRPRYTAITWDAKYLAVVAESGAAEVFDLMSKRSVSPKIHQDGATQAAVSTGGRYLALGGGGEAAVYDVSSGQLRFRPTQLQNVDSIDLTPDGRYLATSGEDGLRVFDVSEGTIAWQKPDFKGKHSNVAFSMNGRLLAAGGEEPELRVFSNESGHLVARVPFYWNNNNCKESRQNCKVTGITFSKDGKYVVLSASDKKVRVIDVGEEHESRVVELPAYAVYATLSEDDRFLATSSSDLMGRIFDLEPSVPQEVWHLPLRPDDFFPMEFASGDKYVIPVNRKPGNVCGSRIVAQRRPNRDCMCFTGPQLNA